MACPLRTQAWTASGRISSNWCVSIAQWTQIPKRFSQQGKSCGQFISRLNQCQKSVKTSDELNLQKTERFLPPFGRLFTNIIVARTRNNLQYLRPDIRINQMLTEPHRNHFVEFRQHELDRHAIIL